MTALVIVASLLAAGLWEYCRPRRRRRFPALGRRLGNLGFWLVNLLLAAFLLGPPERVRGMLEPAIGMHFPHWPIGNAVLSLVAGFLLLDLMRYAVHRCEHAVPLFWRLHALHHSDPDVDVTTSLRHHPFEYILASIPFWLVAVIFDMPVAVVASYGLVVFASEALQHANICLPDRVERWLRPVFVTTDMHRIHHAIGVDQANANFGAVLSVWDRLFGTYVLIARARHREIVFGLRDMPARDCLAPARMVLTPWLLPRELRAISSYRRAFAGAVAGEPSDPPSSAPLPAFLASRREHR